MIKCDTVDQAQLGVLPRGQNIWTSSAECCFGHQLIILPLGPHQIFIFIPGLHRLNFNMHIILEDDVTGHIQELLIVAPPRQSIYHHS